LVLQLGRYKFSFKAQDSINFRKIFTISGGILGIASVILFFVAPPIAPVVGIVAGLASFAKNFFKSKEQKRREAVQKISEKLYTELNQEKRKCLKQADDDFIQSSQSIITEIEVYFNDLIKGLDDIAKHLDKANNELKDNSKWLNRGYAKRIIDWLNDRDEELNDQNINNSIKKVERNFGQKIFIQTKVKISINKSSEELKMVLQEDLIINEPKIS
ncbi:MAG: GTPase, partial [Planktothrix agardhii]